MSPESAEMTKYVANCLLATKISFVNEMANLCEAYGADINDVRRGIGHDQRIGFHFLFPGVGYGGSCFPKDIRAVVHMAQTKGLPALMMAAVDTVNEAQKNVLFQKIERHFRGEIKDKTIAIWGLAFKPRTDDVREAPALVLVDLLLKSGAQLGCTTPKRFRTFARSTATGSSTAIGRMVHSSGRCPGRRHRVERVSQSGFRGDAPLDASTRCLGRPQRLRSGSNGRTRLHLPWHRPGGAGQG